MLLFLWLCSYLLITPISIIPVNSYFKIKTHRKDTLNHIGRIKSKTELLAYASNNVEMILSLTNFSAVESESLSSEGQPC